MRSHAPVISLPEKPFLTADVIPATECSPASDVSTAPEGSPAAEASPLPPYPAYVTERIRRLRVNSGLSQEEVADRMGIRQQTYSEYERGISHMHIEEFVSLARIFDVSVDFITGVSNLRGPFPRY